MEGCKSVAAGMNAMDLRRGITMAVDAVVTNLKSRARMISTSEEIAQVGTHSNFFCQKLIAVREMQYFRIKTKMVVNFKFTKAST